MNIMKKFFLFAFAALFLISCGGNAEDKSKQLAELKKQYEDLGVQIRTLEAEVNANDTTSKEKIIAVVAAPVGLQTFKHYVEVQAHVDTDENVNVSAQTGGLVQRILVNTGDRVTKGQLLAELDNKAMIQSLEEVRTNYNLVKALYDKQKNLWDQKIGSEVQFMTAKANKESLEKRLASVQEQVDMSRIKSSITGTVDAVMIREGQTLAPGMPAIRVVNLSNMKVKAEVPESYAGKLNKGDIADIYFPDRDLTISAKVSFVGKVISKLNRTFDVEVDVNPKDVQLNPNMVAALRIIDMEVDSAIVLPINVVQSSDEGKFVVVAEPKGKGFIARKKSVTVSSTYNGFALIKDGLSPDDIVISVGFETLSNDQPVKF